MQETHRLADMLERVLDGDPWHGSNVLAVLGDLDAAAANVRPWPGAHTIWELVLHMTGWAEEVRARLGGAPADEPRGGDWPHVTDDAPEAWSAAVARLADAHRALAAAIRAAGDAVLDTPVVDLRDPASGTGLSQYLTLHGLVHHTAYHAGQIALVRKAVEARGTGR